MVEEDVFMAVSKWLGACHSNLWMGCMEASLWISLNVLIESELLMDSDPGSLGWLLDLQHLEQSIFCWMNEWMNDISESNAVVKVLKVIYLFIPQFIFQNSNLPKMAIKDEHMTSRDHPQYFRKRIENNSCRRIRVCLGSKRDTLFNGALVFLLKKVL